MVKDRVLAVRFSPVSDEELYAALLAHKEKTATGGSSGEAKRLMRDGLELRRQRRQAEVIQKHA